MSKKITTYTYALSKPVVDSFVGIGEVFEFANGEIEALFYAIDKVVLLFKQSEIEFGEIRYYDDRPFIVPFNRNYNNIRLSDSRAPNKNAILSNIDLATLTFKDNNLFRKELKQRINDAIKAFKVTQKLLNQEDESTQTKKDEDNDEIPLFKKFFGNLKPASNRYG